MFAVGQNQPIFTSGGLPRHKWEASTRCSVAVNPSLMFTRSMEMFRCDWGVGRCTSTSASRPSLRQSIRAPSRQRLRSASQPLPEGQTDSSHSQQVAGMEAPCRRSLSQRGTATRADFVWFCKRPGARGFISPAVFISSTPWRPGMAPRSGRNENSSVSSPSSQQLTSSSAQILFQSAERRR